MAGDWIPMRIDLSDDPAVIAIASAMGCDEFSVVGRLHRLWCWANKHLSSGNAASVSSDWVDRYLSTPGFAAAMQSAGWLQVRSGGIEFPKFERWNSQGAKKRLLTARRVAEHKSKGNAQGNAHGNAHGNAPSVSEALPKEEKRREEEEKTFSAPPEERGKMPPARRGKTPKPPPKPRECDPLFDAIAEVTGLDPKESGSLIGMVKVDLAGRDPPFSAEDVRQFARDFWKHCPHAIQNNRQRPTANEIKRYISLIRAAPPPPQVPQSGRAQTKGEAQDAYAARMLQGINQRAAANAEPVNFTGLPVARDQRPAIG